MSDKVFNVVLIDSNFRSLAINALDEKDSNTYYLSHKLLTRENYKDYLEEIYSAPLEKFVLKEIDIEVVFNQTIVEDAIFVFVRNFDILNFSGDTSVGVPYPNILYADVNSGIFNTFFKEQWKNGSTKEDLSYLEDVFLDNLDTFYQNFEALSQNESNERIATQVVKPEPLLFTITPDDYFTRFANREVRDDCDCPACTLRRVLGGNGDRLKEFFDSLPRSN